MTSPSAPPDEEVHLYPRLDNIGMDFRLTEITCIRDRLECEVQKRDKTRRRFKAAHTATHVVNTGVCVVGSVTSAGAVASLASGVGIMAALPLGIISLASGALNLVGSTAQKILYRKVEKHERLLVLAEVKLSTINAMVSRALTDNSIADTEFEAIQREMSDYQAKKRAIQTKVSTAVGSDIEGLKKGLLEEGRKQGLMEARQALKERS